MDTIQPLETALSSLLETVRGDPWSLLIVQTLLWSFRRWAIYYLTSDEVTTTMREFLWESHLDLVDQHAPEGLREFAIVWLNPDTVGDRQAVLEELNAYFLRLVDSFDHALRTNDDEEQSALAEFIDERITLVLDHWLEEKPQYRIYPRQDDSPDSFDKAKVIDIMQTMLDGFAKGVPFRPVVAAPVPVVAQDHDPVVAPVPVPVVAQDHDPVVAPVPVPVVTPVPAPTTVAQALRRRTMKLKRRTAEHPTRKTNAKSRAT